MKFFGLCCFLVGLTLASTTHAKSYYATVEKISVSDGLPDTTVYSLAKDSTGFLWLGMPTALARYDGYQIRSFSKNGNTGQALDVSSAGNIFIDSQQRIWLGTWGEGLAVYDNNMNLLNHFVVKADDPTTIGSNMVQVIFEDSDGDIWIGSNGGGLAVYQEKTHSFTSYRFNIANEQSISHDRVWDIAQTADGKIWVATSDGLNVLDKGELGKFTRFQHKTYDEHSINHVLIRSLYADGQQLWLGTEIGFGLFDTQSAQFKNIPLFADKSQVATTKIIGDAAGGIWIGSQKGLFRYEPKQQQLTPLASDDNYQLFPHNDVRDMLIDDAGILWVATRYAGVLKINLTSNDFAYYRHYRGHGRNDNEINKVYAMHSDGDHGLWLGMGDGLLYMDSQSKAIKRFNQGVSFGSIRINAIAQQGDKLWLGGPFGRYSVYC